MALIPTELMEQLSSTTTTSQYAPSVPARKQLSLLDSKMKSILEDESISDEVKLKNYYNTLRRFGAIEENALQTPPIPVKVHEDSGEKIQSSDEINVINSVPKLYRPQARLLLQFLRENKDISWNKSREMLYKGRRIPSSNLYDLVSDFSRNSKSQNPASGWKELATALKEQNIPARAIGNRKRLDFIQNKIDPPLFDDSGSEYELYSPARKKKQKRKKRSFTPQRQPKLKQEDSPLAGKTRQGTVYQKGGRRNKRVMWQSLYR